MFSECFWKFIHEKVGITRIFPANPSTSKTSTNKKVISLAERQERIDIMLQKTEFDDDKLNTGDTVLGQWSEDAVQLASMIKRLGVIQDLCVEEYILDFFSSLNVQTQNIYCLDPVLSKFHSLKVINLSFNKIQKIEFIPPLLEELYLNGNEVDSIVQKEARPSLVHLGLSTNKIRQMALSKIAKVFPNLFCLDLSFNDLCDLENALSWCKKLQSLKMLSLEGNPLVLAKNYEKVAGERLPNLKLFDNKAPLIVIKDEAELQKQKTALLKSGQSSRRPGSVDDQSVEALEPNCSFDFHFRLMKNISNGRYLIPDENCNIESEKLDEIPEENKASKYWLSYIDHNNKEVKTPKRSYIQHFQVEDNESKINAKVDMDFKLRFEERPSIELRDWFYNDVLVTLWESRPVFQKIKEEGSEVATEKVVINK